MICCTVEDGQGDGKNREGARVEGKGGADGDGVRSRDGEVVFMVYYKIRLFWGPDIRQPRGGRRWT